MIQIQLKKLDRVSVSDSLFRASETGVSSRMTKFIFMVVFTCAGELSQIVENAASILLLMYYVCT